MIGHKTMAQPQKEWWEMVISWVDVNKTFLTITFFAYKGTDGWFKFLTKLVDGRLKKIAEEVFDEKIAKVDAKMEKMDEKLDQLLMHKK